MTNEHTNTGVGEELQIIQFDGRTRDHPRCISNAQWEQHKPLIKDLHHAGYTRKQILEILKEECNFAPSLASLNWKMIRWHLRVYKQARGLATGALDENQDPRQSLHLTNAFDGEASTREATANVPGAKVPSEKHVEFAPPLLNSISRQSPERQISSIAPPQTLESADSSTNLWNQGSPSMDVFFGFHMLDSMFNGPHNREDGVQEETADPFTDPSHASNEKHRDLSMVDTLSDGVSAMSISNPESWRYSKVTGIPSNPSVGESMSDCVSRKSASRRCPGREVVHELDRYSRRCMIHPHHNETSLVVSADDMSVSPSLIGDLAITGPETWWQLRENYTANRDEESESSNEEGF